MDPALADDNHWVNKARDLFEAQPDLDDAAAFRRLASVLANDLGQMRVRFNPQQHAVPVPYRDDNSYLWDHGESAQPPPEAHALTARGARQDAPPPTDASPPDNAPPDAAAPAELARHAYPEWDYRLGRARPDWSTVIERAAPAVIGMAGGAARQGRAGAVAALNRAAGCAPVGGRRHRPERRHRGAGRPAAGSGAGRAPVHAARSPALPLRHAGAAGPVGVGQRPGGAGRAHGAGSGETRGAVAGGFAGRQRRRRGRAWFSSDTRAAVDYVRLLDFGESPLGRPPAASSRPRAPFDPAGRGVAPRRRTGAARRRGTSCHRGGDRRRALGRGRTIRATWSRTRAPRWPCAAVACGCTAWRWMRAPRRSCAPCSARAATSS